MSNDKILIDRKAARSAKIDKIAKKRDYAADVMGKCLPVDDIPRGH